MPRRTTLRRSRNSRVSPELAYLVLARDQWRCQAAVISAQRGWSIDQCQDRWGRVSHDVSSLELDHVQEDYGMMGKAAKGDIDHLITGCHHHHQHGWMTSHRPELRARIKELNAGGAGKPEGAY